MDDVWKVFDYLVVFSLGAYSLYSPLFGKPDAFLIGIGAEVKLLSSLNEVSPCREGSVWYGKNDKVNWTTKLNESFLERLGAKMIRGRLSAGELF